MGMKKLFMILALSLPLMAQEAEAKETVGKKVVRTIQDAEWSKSKSAHQRDHDKKDGMKRGDKKRGGMEQRNKRMAMAKKRKMHKKRAIRSFRCSIPPRFLSPRFIPSFLSWSL
jgi:hypothetical protein